MKQPLHPLSRCIDKFLIFFVVIMLNLTACYTTTVHRTYTHTHTVTTSRPALPKLSPVNVGIDIKWDDQNENFALTFTNNGNEPFSTERLCMKTEIVNVEHAGLNNSKAVNLRYKFGNLNLKGEKIFSGVTEFTSFDLAPQTDMTATLGLVSYQGVRYYAISLVVYDQKFPNRKPLCEKLLFGGQNIKPAAVSFNSKNPEVGDLTFKVTRRLAFSVAEQEDMKVGLELEITNNTNSWINCSGVSIEAIDGNLSHKGDLGLEMILPQKSQAILWLALLQGSKGVLFSPSVREVRLTAKQGNKVLANNIEYKDVKLQTKLLKTSQDLELTVSPDATYYRDEKQDKWVLVCQPRFKNLTKETLDFNELRCKFILKQVQEKSGGGNGTNNNFTEYDLEPPSSRRIVIGDITSVCKYIVGTNKVFTQSVSFGSKEEGFKDILSSTKLELEVILIDKSENEIIKKSQLLIIKSRDQNI